MKWVLTPQRSCVGKYSVLLSDVLEYILGGENPWVEASASIHLFPAYNLLHHLVVANSFGDDQTVQIIRERITKMSSAES